MYLGWNILFLFIGEMCVGVCMCVCAAGVGTAEAYSALLETKLLSFNHQWNVQANEHM